MGLSQILMMMGATVAGTFFALSPSQQNPGRKTLYQAIGVGGLSLMAFGYIRLSM